MPTPYDKLAFSYYMVRGIQDYLNRMANEGEEVKALDPVLVADAVLEELLGTPVEMLVTELI